MMKHLGLTLQAAALVLPAHFQAADLARVDFLSFSTRFW